MLTGIYRRQRWVRAGARHGQRRTRERGATLLEALVSILVLAIGVLGLLGVQLGTLAETQSSVRRAQTVRLIENLAERVKSNPGGFQQLSAFTSDWPDAPKGADCRAASCTAVQLAAWDVQEWRTAVQAALPNAQAKIFFSPDEDADPANRRQLGVMVGWRVNERKSDAADPKFKSPFEVTAGAVKCPDNLICHVVYIQP